MRKKYMSKFTSIVLSLLMVISVLPQIAFATPGPTIWDGTSDTSWYHETDTSFTITTAKELAGLAELVNGGNNFSGKTITLGADIQLNDTSGWETWNDTYTGNQWTPIGNATNIYFNGTFDGGNYTVSGMYIYAVDTSADYMFAGLFGHIHSDAAISNVNITESNILAEGRYYTYVGGVVGKSLGTVTNCSNSGNVGVIAYSYSYMRAYAALAGGIVGNGDSMTGAITNCTNSGSITAVGSPSVAGGIVGSNSSIEKNGVINCHNTGTVDGYSRSGGIAGTGGYVANCYNTGSISGGYNGCGGIMGMTGSADSKYMIVTNCHNSGAIHGSSMHTMMDYEGCDVGGIVGYNYYCTIINCYNEGTINGEHSVGEIAGINLCRIINCYNIGTITGDYMVGGLAGYNYLISPGYTPGEMISSYNLGTVTCSGATQFGSIAGVNTYDVTTATTIKNCYWLEGTSTVAIGTTRADSEGVVMMTSEEMKATDFKDTLNAKAKALLAAEETLPIVGWKFIAGQNSDYPVYQELLTGTASISGDAVYGKELTASLSGGNNSGTLSYQWLRGGTLIAGATGNTYTLTADDIDNKITVKIFGSEQWGGISSTATWSVQKADCEVTDIAVSETTEVTSSSITVKAVDGYQYACVKSGVTSLSDWWKNSNVFTGLPSNTEYDVYQRVAQTATHKASNHSEKLTVTTGLSNSWIDYLSEPTLDGTTYTITSAGELSWIAKQVQDDMSFEGFTFELTSNIDLSDHFWIAIGGMKTPFSGTFNGNGHTISNLKMDASTQALCGLFGLSDGTLKNILLDGVNISGEIDNNAYIGALCGASMGTITDGVVADATISVNGSDGADIYTGIVCGYHMGSIDSCGAHGTVTINGNANGSYAGGLVGNTDGANIYNSYANVSVTGDDGSKTGGLVGFAYGGNIENCVSYGNTSVPSNASTTYLGGLIGSNSSDEPCTVSNSYWNTSATQSYCGVARASNEMLGIGNNTPETDAADSSCSGKTLTELKSDAFLNTLNDYVNAKNAAGTLSNPLQLWKIVTSNDDLPGFIEVKSTNPDTPDPNTPDNNTPDGGSSYSSSGGGSVHVPGESSPVEVNGKRQDAGTATIQNSGGQTVTTIKVDDTKLDQLLGSSGEKPTVTLPANKASDVVVGELSGQTVKNMEQKAAVLEIKTENVSYTLPAAQINIDAVSSQIGEQVALKDIRVSVKIAEPPADTVKLVESTATKNSYQIVVKPVEFEITCTSGEKTVEVSKFNGYVERTVAIPDGIDPARITTGIVLNSDGTFSHVPTQIVVINGQYFAKINSLTNSTYSVIYNPVAFTDVAKHWAKDAINDMGSRMVVAGTGSGTYEPDRSITRAEFAAVVVRALGLRQGTEESRFGDVSLTDWFNGYVDTAAEYGLITGYDDGRFCPNDTITREQAMAIIGRAMKLAGLSASLTDSEVGAILSRYTDKTNVSGYAKESVAACLKTGIVTGKTATTISSKDYVTRAEVAVLVQRLLQESGLI